MVKRIFLFLLTNILVIVLISLILGILEKVFGINIGGYFNGVNTTSVLIFAAVVGFAGSFISLLLSKQMAKWSYELTFLERNNLHNFSPKERLVYEVVEHLSQKSGIKMPEVGIYLSDEPNAFATGPSKNNSLVAVSSGLLETMNEPEIEGVIAHEMSHITNGDMVTMTLLQGVINTFVIFLSKIVASIVDKALFSNSEREPSEPSWSYYIISIILEICFSLLASLVVMKFSRYREYKADEGSARYVGKEKMIAALRKLQAFQGRFVAHDDDKLATLKIGNKKRGGIFALFSSHPDLEDRIANLQTQNI